jgi:hypothetical protein
LTWMLKTTKTIQSLAQNQISMAQMTGDRFLDHSQLQQTQLNP